MHSIDWADLQYILAVARCGSLAAAARELGVNHATVLRRIAKFEARHGARLFDRQPGGYRLTPDHAHLLASIDLISDQVSGISRMITGEAGGFGGTVHLTTTDTFSAVLMGRHLAGFRAAFPDVVPVLTVTNSRLDLARLDADITIRPAPALPEGFTGTRIGDLVFGLFAPVSEAEEGERLWIGPGETLARSPASEWMLRHVPADRIAARADSYVAMTDLAANGLGRAMIPVCLGHREAGLSRQRMDGAPPSTGVWVAAHKDRARSPRIQAFLSFLTESLAEDAGLLAGQASAGAAGADRVPAVGSSSPPSPSG